MERRCATCHIGHSEPKDFLDICFDGPEENNCFSRDDHPNLVPMTNGDLIRLMADEDFAELLKRSIFTDPWSGYVPELAKSSNKGGKD